MPLETVDWLAARDRKSAVKRGNGWLPERSITVM